MRFLGAVEQLVHISPLRRQQPIGMMSEVMALGDKRLALRKVVKRAKLILKFLPARGLCSGHR